MPGDLTTADSRLLRQLAEQVGHVSQEGNVTLPLHLVSTWARQQLWALLMGEAVRLEEEALRQGVNRGSD